VPAHKSRVNDYANILDPGQRADLEAQLRAYEKETRHQIAVLTVRSLEGESIESYSLRVAKAWALGQKGLNNGVLLTVAPNERKVRIELGKGMSRYVSDTQAQEIISEMLVSFRAGDIGRGVQLGVTQLMKACRAYKLNKGIYAKTQPMKQGALVPALVAISLLGLPAQAAAPAETVGALLLRLQEQSAAPFVQHCGTQVPDLKRPLETEYSRFKNRFRKATASLRAGIGTNPQLTKPASRELVKQFEEMGAQSLAQARQLEARTFCLRLKDNLSHATQESIQKNMQSAFAEYTAAARQGR
jgi:uncharacterized membrane protein YgcG